MEFMLLGKRERKKKRDPSDGEREIYRELIFDKFETIQMWEMLQFIWTQECTK